MEYFTSNCLTLCKPRLSRILSTFFPFQLHYWRSKWSRILWRNWEQKQACTL